MRIYRTRRLALASTMIAASFTVVGTKAVQAADATAVETVIVTAEKRVQDIKDVPASITAIDGDTLRKNRVVQLTDLNGSVPDLQIRTNASNVVVFMRGIGHQAFSLASDNSVGLTLDGVDLSRGAEGLIAFFDVGRVEMLRGPQGTLYGRNATGGVVNVISAAPTDVLSGYASIGVANYDEVDLEGVVSGPLADDIDARVGGFIHRRFEGFGKDLFTGTQNADLDEGGGKAALHFAAGDKFELTLRADGYHANDHSGGFNFVGNSGRLGPVLLPQILGGLYAHPGNPWDNYANVPSSRNVVLGGASLEAKYSVTPNFDIKSITGLRYSSLNFITDVDTTNLQLTDPAHFVQHDSHVSQELQLNWHSPGLYATLGAYYFGELNNSTQDIPTPLYYFFVARGIPIPPSIPHMPGATGRFESVARDYTNAQAVFANVSYDVSDRLTLGAGVRYSYETKSNSGGISAIVTPFFPFAGSRAASGLTPAFTGTFRLNEDVNLYASISRGFKSGEWVAGTSNYARPEFLWDYESGIKGTFFDHQLQLNFGGFYYDYKDLQVNILQAGGAPLVINSPKATVYGLESEAALALPADFFVQGSLAYLHTRFDALASANPNLPGSPVVSLTGNQFPNSPKWQADITLSKQLDWHDLGHGTISVNYQWQDDAYLDIFNNRGNAFRPAYSILNANYAHSFADSRWSVLLWAKNITDKRVTDAEVIDASIGSVLASFNNPQTFGVTLRDDF